MSGFGDELAAFLPALTLHWAQRKDGRWNADCPCGATLCGFEAHDRLQAETIHLGEDRSKAMHAAMLQPENANLLRAWFGLSAVALRCQREEPGPGVGRERFEILRLMDVLRPALNGTAINR